MLSKKIETNALRNLAGTTCILPLHCTFTALEDMHLYEGSKASGLEERGSSGHVKVLIWHHKQAATTIITSLCM